MSSLVSAPTQLRLMKGAAAIPQVIWWPLGQLASLVLAARPPKPLRQWALNAGVVTGRSPSYWQRRAAQFSWIRNSVGSLQLGRWSKRRILNTVHWVDDGRARIERLQAERGVVLALPHMGSWDLLAAYGSSIGLPLSSVAERLPAGQFEYFRDLRAALGMKIHPYGEPNVVAALCDDLRRGRLVCLVADRDFGRRGLPVRWPTPDGGRDLTMPAGPVIIAQQTGAARMGAATTFEGSCLRVVVGEPIPLRAGAEGAEQMGQELAEFFTTQVSAKPTDWHMMQKFFPGVVA